MTEHEHCKDVADELVRRLVELCKKSDAWNMQDPYETEPVKLLIMAEKLKHFVVRLPAIPDER